MTTLTELRALAEAATPGPWIQQPDGWTVRREVAQDQNAGLRGWRVCYTYASGPDRVEQEVADAAYIAALSPSVVLAMIECIEAADNMREKGEADDCFAYDRVRAKLEQEQGR